MNIIEWLENRHIKVNNKKMGDDSGGLSANKAAGQEEEGSTAPFPERVSIFIN